MVGSLLVIYGDRWDWWFEFLVCVLCVGCGLCMVSLLCWVVMRCYWFYGEVLVLLVGAVVDIVGSGGCFLGG